MATAKFKLGQPLPDPARFHVDQTVADERYVYQLDRRRLICRRRSKAKPESKPSYFRLILPANRRWTPDTLLALKHGILIPTLIAGLVIGLALVIYPLLPGLHYQVQKRWGGLSNDTTALAAPDPSHNRLVIPKLGVDTPIWEGPTLAILNKHEGVWHQTGNQADNFVLAGHRFKYLPPNTSTFYNLGELKAGDTVALDWQGRRYLYGVTAIKRVNKHAVEILKPTPAAQITLYTCYDKLQTERIVVVATLQP